MIILGIDTSCKSTGVALSEGARLLGQYQLTTHNMHSCQVFTLIETLLKASNKKMNQVDAIAVTIGPGSFTGLRVGLMTAKTLAHLNKCLLLGISTLEVLSYPWSQDSQTIYPCIDALRGEVYGAGIQWKSGVPHYVIPGSVYKVQEFCDLVNKSKEMEDSFVNICGPVGIKNWDHFSRNIKGLVHLDTIGTEVDPGSLCRYAFEAYTHDRIKSTEVMSLNPVYYRRPEAEIVYDKNHLIVS